MRFYRLLRAFSAIKGSVSDSGRFLPMVRSRNRIALCLSEARSLAVMCAISMLGALLAVPATAASILGDEPIVIKATAREPARIAVPTFDSGRSPVALKQNDFHTTIYNDLELTGYFLRGRDQGFIEETHQRDRKAREIDFAEWQRLDVLFLLAGDYEISRDRLEATCVLYYVPTGRRIFGKRFTNTVDQQRVLAHRIADEVFRFVTAEEGIANTKVLFASTTDPKRQKREIWLMDADGANPRQLTNDGSLVVTPCWGANATEVYYTSYKDYNPDLCGVYLKGGAPWYISRFPGLNISPSWSQRRQRIVLTLGKDGNSEIYVTDRNGKNLKRLTYEREIDSSPQWSPDGNDIVFTSNRRGSPQIYRMDAEGFNAQRISFVGSSYCDSASWSPKGDKIAFTARRDGVFDIWVTELDGSNPQRLTQGQGNNEDPCWSPNGLMLAFTSDRTGSTQIYIMNSDGSNQRRLTQRGYNTSPAWSPFLYGQSN